MLKIYWADADVLRPVNENCLSGYRRRSISGDKNEQVKKLPVRIFGVVAELRREFR